MRNKMKYRNLTELAKAFASGELKDYALIVDNDDSFLSYTGPLPSGMKMGSDSADMWRDEMNDKARALYRGNGECDFGDALFALNIPWENC